MTICVSLQCSTRISEKQVYKSVWGFVCGLIVMQQRDEGKSISNEPIPFPIDRDTQDFHALFQDMF